MNEMTYHQVGRQHRREMMSEAEQEHLAKEARKNRKGRDGLSRDIRHGWKPRRLAGRLLKILRAGKNEG